MIWLEDDDYIKLDIIPSFSAYLPSPLSPSSPLSLLYLPPPFLLYSLPTIPPIIVPTSIQIFPKARLLYQGTLHAIESHLESPILRGRLQLLTGQHDRAGETAQQQQ